MKTGSLLVIGVASLLISGYCSAKEWESPSVIYKNRCANCHGLNADGVPKLKEQPGITAKQAAALGVASQGKTDIQGPALNVLSEEELVAKLKNIKSKDYNNESYHGVMRKNMKKIEDREGKITDQKMAKYIFTTFGPGKK